MNNNLAGSALNHAFNKIRTVSANYGATWGADQLELKFDPQPTDSVNNSIWDVRFTALGMGNPDRLTDILGNKVAELVNENKPAGRFEVDFDGATLSNGVYFYQLNAGSFIQTKKMMLIK